MKKTKLNINKKGELEEYIANLPKWEELEERQREEGVREYIYTVIFDKDIIKILKIGHRQQIYN